MMETTLVLSGLGIAAATLASILWSIVSPKRRIWPPQRYTAITPILVWVPTFSLFGVFMCAWRLGVGHFGVSQLAPVRGWDTSHSVWQFCRLD